MRPRGTGVPGRTGLYRLAGALTVLVLGALATASALDVALASRLVAENGVVEWLQVVVLIGAGATCLRLAALDRAEGESGAPDVLLAAGFAFVVVSEMELPKLLVGKIRLDRLMRDVAAGLPRQTIFVVVVAGLALGAAIYALQHLPELLAWSGSALGTDWGRLFYLAAAILVITELFERALNRMMASVGLPGPLLEETLELIASVYCLIAMRHRAAARYR